MILIITEEADYSSSLAIDWFLFYKINFIRLNENDLIEVDYKINDIEFKSITTSFLYSELSGVWYRRGFLNIVSKQIDLNTSLDNFRKIEQQKLNEYLYFKLSQLPHINRYTNSDVNKLIVCNHAKSFGLIVPEEYILNNKNEINKLLELNKKIITKSISGSTVFNSENSVLIAYTTLVNKINNIPSHFFPSLIQECVSKKFELRIFYLHKVFYSMAIFSQNDNKTKVDFRNYNRKNPNRNVPFELPILIKEKLINLMNKLNLNSGSIDMIVTIDNEFIFLEVNPIGQYGMVSNPCNYNLNKVIAEYFKNI